MLPGYEHQILEIIGIRHHQGIDRLAVAIEEVAVLGIHCQGYPLHRLQAAVGHRGADVREFDREIEVDLGVFQVARLTVHLLHLQVQLGLAICAALDVHLGGDFQCDDLFDDLSVPTGLVGIDDSHIQIQGAGIVGGQTQGQVFQAIEAAWQLDQVLAVDEVVIYPLQGYPIGQTCNDDAHLIIGTVEARNAYLRLELSTEIDPMIFNPNHGGWLEDDLGRLITRCVGQDEECRRRNILNDGGTDIPVIAVVEDASAHLEVDPTGKTIRSLQAVVIQIACWYRPVALAITDAAIDNESRRQAAYHQIIDPLTAAGIEIFKTESPNQIYRLIEETQQDRVVYL
ncbi:hypothetical protein D3C87_988300 [compost metagenome]